jgi:predicted NBD/HSP70 family sugar kinase
MPRSGPRSAPKVNPAMVRRWNVMRVFHALRDVGMASHGELVGATGLDPATVTAVLRQLRERGWVYVVGVTEDAPPTRAGRPPIRLAIDPGAGLLIGARLEPGAVRLVATTLAGEGRGDWQGPAPTDPVGAVAALDAGIDALLRDLETDRQVVRAVGVGVPALIARDGHLAFGPNLDWQDVPLQTLLAQGWSVPVVVDNDTKAAAIAERLFGAGRDARDFVVVAGHSGVGGALFLDGRLVRGASGFAGELGHVSVVPDGRRCGCGDRGCLEAYLSERSLVAQLRERGGPDHVHGYEGVASLAALGDERTLSLLADVGALLGGVLADLVDLLDPERIVLAGALTHVVPYLTAPVEAALRGPGLARYRSPCRVLVSPLGPDVVPLGGIALAMDAIVAVPDAWTVPARHVRRVDGARVDG